VTGPIFWTNVQHALLLFCNPFRSGDLLARRYALMCLKLARTGDVFDVATVEAFHHKLTAMAPGGLGDKE